MQNMRVAGQVLETTKPREQGLAAWVLTRFRAFCGGRSAEHKHMRLLETLSLGGKRQLMLVKCGEERYLVGGGPESVQTIVRTSGQAATCELSECR
jgi:flagellar biogenesis protein FliO